MHCCRALTFASAGLPCFFLFVIAAACYVRLHGWGMPVSLEVGPADTWLLLISINGVVYINATAWNGVGQGVFTYVVDPNTCIASNYNYWNTFSGGSAESIRLTNYLQSLDNGNRVITWSYRYKAALSVAPVRLVCPSVRSVHPIFSNVESRGNYEY